jgi:hypothetical protein
MLQTLLSGTFRHCQRRLALLPMLLALSSSTVVDMQLSTMFHSQILINIATKSHG